MTSVGVLPLDEALGEPDIDALGDEDIEADGELDTDALGEDETEAEGLALGLLLMLALGEALLLGEELIDADGEAEILAEGLELGLLLMEAEGLALSEALGEAPLGEGLEDGEADIDELTDALGLPDMEVDGEELGE